MDAVTLDGLLEELGEVVTGRHLSRARVTGAHSLSFEVSGNRGRRLWLEAARGMAGFYLLSREEERVLSELAGGEARASGRTRQSLLLLRKHLNGARVTDLRRIPGRLFAVLEAGGASLGLRLGAAPALTLSALGTALSTLGEGEPAWPWPEPAPEREWDEIDAATIERAIAGRGDRSTVWAILDAAPSFGPLLARELDGTAASLERLRSGLRAARPTLIGPSPMDEWTDADLARERAVSFLPFAPSPPPPGVIVHAADWTSAAAAFLSARLRGRRFAQRQRSLLDAARLELRRLQRLAAHLAADESGLPEPTLLRREGDALLAAPAQPTGGADRIEVADPYSTGATLQVRIDPALSLPKNADRLFEKARRIERARRKVGERLQDALARIEEARCAEEAALRARNLGDLAPEGAPRVDLRIARATPGPRRYLTSRGLTLLVGRGGKENHHVTFGLARPEDLWLHARDVPGAHVILRDDEGRAAPDDLREAAEVAAFFSEKENERGVDVHVTRRKHVRPGRGGSGRVTIAHSDTLRVDPRDPEGRLRRR